MCTVLHAWMCMYRDRRRDRTVEFGKWIRVEGTYVGRLCSAQLNGQVMMETQQWKLELGSQIGVEGTLVAIFGNGWS